MKRIANQWKDYECCDAGDGEKLERWQNIILRRPDPQAVWKRTEHAGWNRVHAHYHRSNRGGGSWEFKQAVPETWTVSYKELTFKAVSYTHLLGISTHCSSIGVNWPLRLVNSP